jgi:2-methylisocitrate lyase-like PEP mutase family enzyme
MFADLHRPGDPLILPNAWDHASAAALAAAGFEAIGTTSLGVAAALGVPDGASATKEATYELAARLVHLPVPISVDAEHGFSEDPREVAEYAHRLEALGVAGINLEDRNGDPKRHAAAIAAVKDATTLFVNARTDTYWLGDGTQTEQRCRAYIEAGADGIFVPGIREGIEALAALGAPLNVLFLPGMTVEQLAGQGVARISTGSLLFRAALHAAIRAAKAVRAGETLELPSYAEVDSLSRSAA